MAASRLLVTQKSKNQPLSHAPQSPGMSCQRLLAITRCAKEKHLRSASFSILSHASTRAKLFAQ